MDGKHNKICLFLLQMNNVFDSKTEQVAESNVYLFIQRKLGAESVGFEPNLRN